MRKVLYLMAYLDDGDVEWLATNGTSEFVSSGTVLIQEKRSINSLYILLDGKLTVNIAAAGNREVAQLFTGEVIGEMSLIDSHPPSASVTAVMDCHVLAIPKETLTEKLARDLGFAARFYRGIAVFLAQRLRVTTSRFGYGSPDQDEDPSELDDESMDGITAAASRFDDLLKRLRMKGGVK